MGCLRLCGCGVAVVAVLLGLIPTALREILPILEEQEGRESLKGMMPWTHRGKPFGFTFEEIPDLTGKVAIVTGANVGLGYWTALHLARRGAHVIVACRSMPKCEEATKAIKQNSTAAAAEPWLLDLSDLKSVRAFARKFQATFKRLDALVLNAGVMVPPYTLSKDGIELQFATNHVGHQLLATTLLPELEAAAPSTVTAVSSNAHYGSYEEGIRLSLEALNDPETYNRIQAYGQSKLANVLFAQELAVRAPAGVFVNAVHPGAVDTELGRHLIDAVKATLGEGAGNALNSFMKSMLPLWDPETAALSQLFTAVSPKVAQEGIKGKYFHPIARLTTPHEHCRNKTLQEALWRLTEDIIASKSSS